MGELNSLVFAQDTSELLVHLVCNTCPQCEITLHDTRTGYTIALFFSHCSRSSTLIMLLKNFDSIAYSVRSREYRNFVMEHHRVSVMRMWVLTCDAWGPEFDRFKLCFQTLSPARIVPRPMHGNGNSAHT